MKGRINPKGHKRGKIFLNKCRLEPPLDGSTAEYKPCAQFEGRFKTLR